MKLFGTPTGKSSFRQGFRGKMILRIEYRWSGWGAGERTVRNHLDWRDAVESDLRHPALRHLLPVAEARS